MKLAGRKALVTGSSKGIGQAIAIRYAEEGADVVVNYKSDPKGADETVARVQHRPARGRDQRRSRIVTSVQALVEQGWDALGGIDILVNNAGVESQRAFLGRHRAGLRQGSEHQPQGRVLRHPDVREEAARLGPWREGDQRQLGARGAAVPELRRLLRQQGRREDVDAEPRDRAGPLGITINSIAPGAIASHPSTPSC